LQHQLEEELENHKASIVQRQEEAEEMRKLNRQIVRSRYSEKEILDTHDKSGKVINRPAVVFMSTAGGGNQKVMGNVTNT
jgi:hypothetical protein